jgi:uncharacterized coiled-coil protein SlyX
MSDRMYDEVKKRILGVGDSEREETERLKKTVSVQQQTIAQLQIVVMAQRQSIETLEREVAALEARSTSNESH